MGHAVEVALAPELPVGVGKSRSVSIRVGVDSIRAARLGRALVVLLLAGFDQLAFVG
jgi:hypothetical protein